MRNSCSALAALWLLYWTVFPTVAAGSEQSLDAGTPFRIDVWESDNGLPHNTVISIIQSEDGYLWLGTFLGLARFDGIRFTVYDESTTPGLRSSPIVALFEDSRRNLWIGTEKGGISVVRGGEVTKLEIEPQNEEARVAGICEDSTGAVWFHTTDGRVARCFAGRVENWELPERPSRDFGTLIVEESGLLRIGTEHGIYALDPADDRSSGELPLVRTQGVTSLDYLLASKAGGYWRLADGRVQKWKEDVVQRDFGSYPWGKTTRVRTACEDRDGNLIVGTVGEGIYWYDSNGDINRFSQAQGLSYDYILSLRMDREENLWVGTDGGGLNRIKRQVFEVLPLPEESRDVVVQSASEDSEGGIWFGVNRIGANASGVARWKNGDIKWFGPREGMLSSSVRSIFIDRDQQIWAGTWGAGLFQFQNDRFKRVALPADVDPYINAIYQDRAGSLWIGTERALAEWDGLAWKAFSTEDGMSGGPVRALADDRQGNLWIGTADGLNRLTGGRFTVYRKSDGLPSEMISSLYVDGEDTLWIGTSGSGLARFKNGKWTRYTTHEGLVSNIISYLIEDQQGYIWTGSNRGLMRIEKKTLSDFASGLTNVTPSRAYNRSDGLPALECMGFQPGALRGSDGTLWFPTIKGLVSVNPAKLRPNPQPPPVVIESVLIDGQTQNENTLRAEMPEAITVPVGKERLEIHFTSLNLAAPDRARFKYRLEGHETDWTESGSIRIARYSKLPPDEYRFQVTASNEDGVWNETGRSLLITVVPPFWRTWWFLGSVVAGLLGATVGSVHYVSTQRLKRQVETLKQQELIERERARIARDIHDQLGASLTQVALLGELVETDKDLPAEVEAHAQQIAQTARDTTRVLDEIVWTVNPSNDTLDGLITYVCKYAQEYLAVAGLRYRLEVPPELPEASISPEVRHNVFLASKEAVTNIVRHAKATAAHIRMHIDRSRFTLEIEDNGRGLSEMDENAAQSRNGLRNMRKRMEDIGGKFSFGSGKTGGVVVRLIAPFGSDKRDRLPEGK